MAHRPYEPPTPARSEALEELFKALRRGDVSAVRDAVTTDPTLVGDYDPNPWCCRATPLNVAASSGNEGLVALLLEMGADPNQKSAWWAGGFAPLHSVDRENDAVIAMLVEAGAVVDVHAAAALGREADLVALLDHDPHLVNALGGDGGRPLHFAADVETVDVLVDRGALIDAQDADHGSTAAQWAVRDRPEVTRRLLEHGAEADVFMLAALGDPSPIESWLQGHPGHESRVMTRDDFPAPGSPASHMYVYNLGDYGIQPLHVAARFGNVDAIDLLVGAGADVACRGGYDEQTPLHTAAGSNRPAAVARLVELGADVDVESGSQHQTPPIVWATVFAAVRGVEAMIAAGAAVTPGVIRSAEAGVRGEFDAFSNGTRHDFQTILDLVTAAA